MDFLFFQEFSCNFFSYLNLLIVMNQRTDELMADCKDGALLHHWNFMTRDRGE